MKVSRCYVVIIATLFISMIYASGLHPLTAADKNTPENKTEVLRSVRPDIQNAKPVLAPLNPEYLEYIEKYKDHNPVTVTSDGTVYSLGLIPSSSTYKATIPSGFIPTVLPSSYDLRNEGYVTPPKNQGSCGSCWAFATYGSIESYWLKTISETHDLSENNLIYGHGFIDDPCSGGKLQNVIDLLMPR